MVVVRSPMRLAFFGGGTDFRSYFVQNGGAVIEASIDKYAYVTARKLPPFFSYKTQINHSIIEKVVDLSEIKHNMVRESLKFLNMKDLHISFDTDLPAQSGLGTSSAFSTALLLGLHHLKGENISTQQLAEEAIYLERTLCLETGGWQDQIASAYGGFNRIDFQDNEFTVTPLSISKQREEVIQENLMLFFTGYTRLSSDIAKDREKNAKTQKQDFLRLLHYVEEAEKILIDDARNLDDFGMIMEENWQVKRSLSKNISSSVLDDIYATARKSGATGGKLMGAGGGGFFIFYVPKEKQEAVKCALQSLLYVPFSFSKEGTTILFTEEVENQCT